MRDATVKLLVLPVALAMLALSANPADAATPVRFTKIQYDSPGSDNGSNTSLNAEWVVITNKGTTKRALTGWTLRDLSNHVFKFPTLSLNPGASVKVHTGRGTNSRTDLYWKQTSYVWNNTGDKAILKNSAGTLVDTCSWSGSGSTTSC